MSIDHLEETLELPKPPGEIEDPAVRNYLRTLINVLQETQLARMRRTINFILDMANGGWLYFAMPDPDSGVYDDGTWRIGVVSSGVEVQEKVAGTWTKRWRQD